MSASKLNNMHTYKSKSATYRLVKETIADYNQVSIKSSKDTADYLRPIFGDNLGIFEEFYLVLLNQRNNTIAHVRLSQGGLTATLVDIRLLAKYAIDSLATSIIIAHNHPSGALTPSEPDQALTRKVKEAMKLFDIRLLDHIILTETSYYSFADEGVL